MFFTLDVAALAFAFAKALLLGLPFFKGAVLGLPFFKGDVPFFKVCFFGAMAFAKRKCKLVAEKRL